jgi:hypothetical protein
VTYLQVRRLRNWDSIPGIGKRFYFFPLDDVDNYNVAKLAAYKVAVSYGIKQPERGADHLPSPSVEISNGGTIPKFTHTILHVVVIN